MVSEDEITSEHTCVRSGQILGEIETLRPDMGRSDDACGTMQVHDAYVNRKDPCVEEREL